MTRCAFREGCCWGGELDCGAPVVDAEGDLLEVTANSPFHRVELL